jgi:hypothetical protein
MRAWRDDEERLMPFSVTPFHAIFFISVSFISCRQTPDFRLFDASSPFHIFIISSLIRFRHFFIFSPGAERHHCHAAPLPLLILLSPGDAAYAAMTLPPEAA